MVSRREQCSISSSWMLPKARISFFPLVLFILVFVLHVPSATGISLKGQKAVFQSNKLNEYWILSPTIKIPDLKAFTLCVDVRLKKKNNKGAAIFTYNTDSQRNSKHDLSFMVKRKNLVFWLFCQEIEVEKTLALHIWHSLCLTWNYLSKEAHIYVNKTLVESKTLDESILRQNGSLVLGRQHKRKANELEVDLEMAFDGDLYLFRLWDFEKDQMSISELKCEDGTIVTWESQQWVFVEKMLEYDTMLICYVNFTADILSPSTTTESNTLNMTLTSLKTTGNRKTPSTSRPQSTTEKNRITVTTQSQITTANKMTTSTFPPQSTTANKTTPSTFPPQSTTESLLEITTILDATGLNASAVGAIVSQLEDILQMEAIDASLARTLVDTISTLLNASPDVLASFSTRLIKSVETIGLKLNFTTETIDINSSSLALAVSKVNSTAFGGLTFSINNINPQVSLDEGASQGNVASINLPSSLLNNLTSQEQEEASRVQFTFYATSILFQDPSMENTSDLNSYIIASSVANLSITNLTDLVQITFRNLEPAKNTSDVQCVYWDFSKNNGTGGWNSDGCRTEMNASNETICECDHLTHFGILLALSRDFVIDETNNRVLTFITYIGCGLSSILLAVTLVTYLTFEKLRRDYPSKILINLCAALLLLNMTFLIDAWISSYNIEGLCITVAVLLHYFLLVSFTWMSLEAFHMYLSLVKVFNTYVRRYMLKFCIVGWGTPIIVIAIVLSKPHNYALEDYDKNSNSTIDTFCWIKDETAFYVAVVGYFCVMFLLNVSMFIVVMIQLCRIKKQKQHQNAQRSILQDMKSVTGLTFLLGITWGFAFFAWGPANLTFMYLFAIFNTLQGAFIFTFHCLTKETVQKQWRRYLCCGKMRLPENSDWSRTATNNTKKMQSLVQAMSSTSTSNNSLQSNCSLFQAKDYCCHPNVNGAKF